MTKLPTPVFIRWLRRQGTECGMYLLQLALQARDVLNLPVRKEGLEQNGKTGCELSAFQCQVNGLAKEHEFVLGGCHDNGKFSDLIGDDKSNTHSQNVLAIMNRCQSTVLHTIRLRDLWRSSTCWTIPFTARSVFHPW